MRFEDAYNDFIILGTKHLKKQSLDLLTRNFNNHILIYFQNFKISDLTKNELLKWKTIIYDSNYSNSFNNTLYVEFNSFLNYCVDMEYLETNYLKLLGNFKKRIEFKKFDFYTLKEFNKFIKGFDNEIYKQFFNLLFFTGLRPSEAMALKFSDLDHKTLFITKSIQRKGKREIDTPKNSSSVRCVKIDNKLNSDLLNLKKYYSNFSSEYFIFGGSHPLSPSTIDRYKLSACNKVGIRPITQHQFRHSHATLLLSNNILINEISKRLGHSRVSTTFDIYTHTNLLQEKRVLDTLNSIRFNFSDLLTRNFKSLFKH